METQKEIVPTRKEILKSLEPFLKSNPLIDKRFTELLKRLAQCIRYEIDHNVFLWHMYAKGEEIPSELKGVFVSPEEYDEFRPGYDTVDIAYKLKFLSVDFIDLLWILDRCIDYETEGYNYWGAHEDEFNYIEDTVASYENMSEYEKALKKYCIESGN